MVHWWKYDLLTEMLLCTDGNMTYWQRCCGCTSHGMKGRKAKWQNPLYPKICHRLPCPLVPPSFSLILRVTLSKSRHWREKFIVILFSLLFPFLCPKKKTKSLSIALLALYKRRNCSHRSFKQSKSILALFCQKSNNKNSLLITLSPLAIQKMGDSHENPKSEFPTRFIPVHRICTARREKGRGAALLPSNWT